MPDKLIPGKKRTMAYNKPSATKYIAPDNAMSANMAARQNLQPANTNPPPIMKKGPFKMNYNKSSFPFKSSPAKHDVDPHTEHDELTGTVNDSGTRVIDESGKWTGVGDRPDLATKEKVETAKKIGASVGNITGNMK
jgi:hypothetical protein